MSSLLQELKRRNVLRVAVLYVVLGWVVMQVADVMSDVLEMPAWTGKLIFIILVVGFPLVVAFAWAFEITPEGIKRESAVDRSQSITHETGRKLNVITGVMAGIAILLIAAQSFVPGLRPAAAARDGKEGGGVNVASIAVLPFVNMSSDKEQEYFSDGLSEELLNLLAKIPELTVISRTSSFEFKGKNEDVRAIGQKLGVAHVLEGSVRKDAGTVRITAQLIKTADGSHLWSDTYTRPLSNIFALQDEISGEVVKALRIKLLGAAPQVSTAHNTEAYDLLLQARDVMYRGRAREDFAKAIDLIEKAIALEPKYARAWSDLAAAEIVQVNNAYTPFGEGHENARRAAQRSIDLDPKLPDGHAALASIAAYYDWDWSAAEKHIQAAEALDPANLKTLSIKATTARMLGRFDEAVATYRRVIDRDPLDWYAHHNLASTLRKAGRFTESESQARRAVELGPEISGMHGMFGLALMMNGKAEQALVEARAERDAFWQVYVLAMAYHALGRNAEATASLKQFEQCCAADGAYQVATVHAYFGNVDAAFKWLDRAYEQRDPGLADVKGDQLLKSLRNDPRYVALLRKMRLPDS